MKKAVFLDAKTVGDPTLLEPLYELPLTWEIYETTDPSQVAQRIKEAEIVLSNKVVLKDSLASASKLQLIVIPATGYDHIDLEMAGEQNITVCNAPGYSTSSVAQHTMTSILALASHLVTYVDLVRQGAWQKNPLFTILDFPIHEVEGKMLGLVGYGEIGKKVETLAKAFGMKVVIAGHPRKKIEGSIPLDDLIQEVDFLSLHIPLTRENIHLISEKRLQSMKPTSFLINTARGKLIDEKALVKALEKGWIGGAALDVLSEEPPSTSHPLLQKTRDNLLITPHIAWGSVESRKRLLSIVKKNIESFLQGTPLHQVLL